MKPASEYTKTLTLLDPLGRRAPMRGVNVIEQLIIEARNEALEEALRYFGEPPFNDLLDCCESTAQLILKLKKQNQ